MNHIRRTSISFYLRPSSIRTYHHNQHYNDNQLQPTESSSPSDPTDYHSRLRLIILGPPGSGKGTHCKKLIETFNIKIIGTGDLLRSNVDNQTELGKIAEDYISKGALLPDDVILELVKPEIKKLKDRNWILDGLPRTKSQAIQLDNFLKEELDDELNLVASLEVPDHVIIKRITDRWIHPPSGRVYNTSYNPPLIAGKDDYTGEPLQKRKDDTIQVFGNRLKSFHLENRFLLDYYQNHFVFTPHLDDKNTHHKNLIKQKKLVHFFGDSSDQIWPDMLKLIQQRFPQLEPAKKMKDST